jgi:wobble nucleotide-excising tRNase
VNIQNGPSPAEESTARQPVTISKIAHIRGIGRFRNYAPQGDTTFKKFTLIYGENGRGKTTLCSILRSLQTRQSAIIQGRRTLGLAAANPYVVITLQPGQALFLNGVWKPASLDINLRIFDAQYIAENVYSGDTIGSDQRRNLCRVILGQEGVALASRYDEIDKEIGELNAAIRAAKGIITSHANSMPVEKFVALDPDPDIDAKIEVKAIEVQGLKETDALKNRPGLIELAAPPLPSHLENMLGRTLEDVSRDAEQIVRAHITSHGMAEHGEKWIATGLSHVTGEICPFCGQSIRDQNLLTAYRAFFNESYRQLQSELARYRSNTADLFSEEKIQLLKTQVAGNLTSADLWGRYVAISKPEFLDTDRIASVMAMFRNVMLKVLDQKLASPLDAIELPPSYKAARDHYAPLKQALDAYNQQIARVNSEIASFKAKADPSRTHAAERELVALRAKKSRFEPAVKDACEKFKTASINKIKSDEEKQKVRGQLDSYSEAVLLRYKNAINTYLKRFKAGFQIDRVKVEYSGRVPNSTFSIIINETPVEVGSADTPINQPSFRNTLSAGERSTLALAFFLAELTEDKDKVRCVAVFDDPFSSQDWFRRTCTIGEIKRSGDQIAQVVVLSHDPRFLKAIWDLPLPPQDRKALELVPSGGDTVIGEWDIERGTESKDGAERRILIKFYHNPREGELWDVIQKLRPVAETHMRRLAPDQLADVTGLGRMIERIRSDQMPASLIDCLHDLTDINSFTRRYMHGENPNAASEPISRDELHGFVGKLLEIAGVTVGL